MVLDGDTIAAISTAAGRGAIAVVRLSGPAAHEIARRMIAQWPEMPRKATLTTLYDPVAGERVDQALIIRFDAPHSYTGEPMVEISCHGGLSVPAAVLRVLLHAGARNARPGEFTQRAVLNGKVDLLQAEGIAELVDARTDAHRRIALSQVEGSLSVVLAQLQQKMLELEALLAYELDFPEEDDGPLAQVRVQGSARDILATLQKLLATTIIGQVAKSGATVVIAGLPNAGKSSLFNALAGEQRAIVTEYPGTTRDALEVVLDDDRFPLRLIDTAGLRDTSDIIERLGIEVSIGHFSNAMAILACGERREDIDEVIRRVRDAGTTAQLLRVRTKADLHPSWKPTEDEIVVSAVQRVGLGELVEGIRQVIASRIGTLEPLLPVITRARQQVALEHARDEIVAFVEAWDSGRLPSIVAAVHVRSAVHALHELIGRIDSDAILGAVFERFCVGK